jgi:hypothetical protein
MATLFAFVVPSICAAQPDAPAETKQANEARAAKSFEDGTRAFERGDFEGAANYYEQAYELVPNGGVAYNAALAWEAAANVPRAADALARAAQTPGLPKHRAQDVSLRLSKALAKVSIVDVSCPAGTTVSLGYARDRACPSRLYALPGEIEITAKHADAQTTSRRVSGVAGGVVSVTMDAPEPPPERPPPPPPPPPETGQGDVQRVVGWVLVGTGAALFGTSFPVGVAGMNARDDFNGDRDNADLRDEAIRLRTVSNALWISGLAVAGAGVVVVLTAPSEPDTEASPSAVGFCIAPGAASLCGRF